MLVSQAHSAGPRSRSAHTSVATGDVFQRENNTKLKDWVSFATDEHPQSSAGNSACLCDSCCPRPCTHSSLVAPADQGQPLWVSLKDHSERLALEMLIVVPTVTTCRSRRFWKSRGDSRRWDLREAELLDGDMEQQILVCCFPSTITPVRCLKSTFSPTKTTGNLAQLTGATKNTCAAFLEGRTTSTHEAPPCLSL